MMEGILNTLNSVGVETIPSSCQFPHGLPFSTLIIPAESSAVDFTISAQDYIQKMELGGKTVIFQIVAGQWCNPERLPRRFFEILTI